jgi:Protein of unknown function (DUF3604)
MAANIPQSRASIKYLLFGTRHTRVVTIRLCQFLTALAVVFLMPLSVHANPPETVRQYSLYAESFAPRNLYWGDTHLHTKLSFDANNTGNTRLGPEEAYKFARGESVISNSGLTARLREPLDFLVIADHAEYLGIINSLNENDPSLLATDTGRRWKQMRESGNPVGVLWDLLNAIVNSEDLLRDASNVKQSIWLDIANTADRNNIPGVFTTFIGYEWTSMPAGNNLHRVVLFKDDASKAVTKLPFSMLDSSKPEDLWQFLEDYEADTGGEVIAIPHNSNVSGGLMFNITDSNGETLTTDYARTRARWEPLMEVTQIKGDSETHPFLSPDDIFSDYERWDKGLMDGEVLHQDWMYPYEYARSALKLGLKQQSLIGINPFKFGMIGSTDSHTSLPAVEENYFWGKLSVLEPRPNRTEQSFVPEEEGATRRTYFDYLAKETAASGYAAVWAEENTRDSIFAAMKRRETYATTGPRMIVRFFGGWTFAKGDHLRPDFAAIGYRQGVSMGGDLNQAPSGKAPQFLIAATKAPQGANLERAQIVKGWLDTEGKLQEKVYDAVLSGDRTASSAGDIASPITSTVDVTSATYFNTTGAVELSTVWQDPDFNPQERAFYYLRVLEIPTPRWTTYDSAFFGTDLPEGVPVVQQERAYTSPIWYTP